MGRRATPCPSGNVVQGSQDIPKLYKLNYKEVMTDDDSSVWSGPPLPLTGTISFAHQKWIYWKSGTFKIKTNQAELIGSLAHAREPNERLGLVRMSTGDVYIFVYTAKKRENGVDIRQFRDVMVKWFQAGLLDGAYDHTKATQSINLDGGGSIYVSWTGASGETTRIARGSVGDEIPTRSGKKVANLLKISPAAERPPTPSPPSPAAERPSTPSPATRRRARRGRRRL